MTDEAFDALLRLIATMVEANIHDPDGEGFYRRRIETATDEARRLIVGDTTR